MSRQEIYQKYETKNALIIIKEDKKKYIKQNEEIPYCALLFTIKEKSSENICKYTYDFLKLTTKNEINAFITNFLEDVEFRNNNAILISGEINNQVFPSRLNGVNLQCCRQIESLNKKEVIDEEDLNILRTQGMDKYSNMSFETIEELIDPDIMIQIKNKFTNSAKVLKVCRWFLRGLNLNHAIQKVLYDEKIMKEKKKKNIIPG